LAFKLVEKEQLATASAVFGNYYSTQSATPIPMQSDLAFWG